mgnify:FL=1
MTDWWASVNDVVKGGKQDHHALSSMVRSQNDLYMVVNNNGAEINAWAMIFWRHWIMES